MEMAEESNAYGQRIGPALPGWSKRPLPSELPLIGGYCRLEKFDPACHAAELYSAFAEASDGRDWTYMPAGPFASQDEYVVYMQKAVLKSDPLHHAILVDGKPVGSAALMRIDPDNGIIEVGHVSYSRRLQRTKAGTEAMFLLMRRAFDELGYRRYEWKCDSLNAPSRQAAERYGFQFEGIFRQAIVYKGRSRDTAWFSIIDGDWPNVRAAFEKWLSPENFDSQGKQRQSLTAIRNSL
jgi:RimJ/RimL family protein N-acetyltransferase